MTTPTIVFRTKIRDGANGRPFVKVPAVTRSHCDMHAFRSSNKFGSYANSDLFGAILARELKSAGVGDYLWLDDLPACVSVDDSGFLAEVTITLGTATCSPQSSPFASFQAGQSAAR